MVTVPIEPEIPRLLFEPRLNVTEFADAIGAMAKVTATNRIDTAILRLVVLTARSPFTTKLLHPLTVDGCTVRAKPKLPLSFNTRFYRPHS